MEPYEEEGGHAVEGTDAVILLDHDWDKAFGYAFGIVHAVGPNNINDLAPGDLVHFTRHAYIEETDEHGVLWLVVNQEDCLAKIEVDKIEGGQDPDCVDGSVT